LAEAIDWKAWLEARQEEVGLRSLQLLDVACGSGKFPAALSSYADIESAAIKPIDYTLLDPSDFSIAEARQALAFPFTLGAEFEMTLQDLNCLPGEFDIVWATHALYAIPHSELETALKRFVYAMRRGRQGDEGGVGVIAHASDQSHYLQFYQHYLNGFKEGLGVPYSSSEQILTALAQMGVTYEVEEISYANGAPESQKCQVEGYLQRCLFDDTLSLKDMMADSIMGPYLETCRKDGHWQFEQNVTLIFLKASPRIGNRMK
jgi:SAM-dependent methyltransferase